MKRRNWLVSSVTASAFLAGAIPASAQQIEEIIVTAQKREESLQNVPMAVSAFAGETLLDFGVTSTQQLQAVTPGLVFNNTGPGAQPFLRGIGTRLTQNGMDPSVAMYIDDRYEPGSSAMMFELADVERIEVLKGPQGTLYGRNATAGAIRVITQGVDDEFGGKAAVSAGNYDMYSLSGTVNVPLSPTLGTRITALVKERDGFAENVVPGTRSQVDDLNIGVLRGKVRWEATDYLTSNLTLGYSRKQDASGLDQVDISRPANYSQGVARGGISGDREHTASALSPMFDLEQYTADLRFDADLGDVDLVSITTYADTDTFTIIDADGTSAPVFDSVKSVNSTDAFTQEFQVLSSVGDWDWIAGAYYFHGDVKSDGIMNLGAPVLFSTGNQTTETDAYALFAQATWSISEAWELTIGGRWSEEQKEVDIAKSKMTAGPSFALVPFSDTESWNDFSPKVTLQRNFEDAMVYLTYSRGFKSGGYNYPARSPAGVGKALDPEILDMLELGVKSDLMDGRVRANAALYAYDYSDLQVTRAGGNTSTGTVLATTENAADASVYGLDVNLTWLLSERLTLTAGGNFTDSEYSDYDATARVFTAVITGTSAPGMGSVYFDADGHSLLRAPDWSGFVSLQYDLPFGDSAHMPIDVTYSYKDEFDFDFVADPLSEPLRHDAYGLLTARISYVPDQDSWRVAVWGNNLTDEEYFDDVVGAGSGLRASWGLPRTYGVDVSYDF